MNTTKLIVSILISFCEFLYFLYQKFIEFPRKDASAQYGEDCTIATCDSYTINLLTCSSGTCLCPNGYFYLNKQCGIHAF